MTMKGQMKPTCRVSSMASRQERIAKAMSHVYYCIEYSHKPDLQKKSQNMSSTVVTHH